jgi:glycosyltransferase involved in cell wall biosynthesis
MKILYIITSADGGGAQKYVLDLAARFGGGVAAGNEKSDLFEQAKKLRLAVYPVNSLKRNISPVKDIRAIFEIRRIIKSVNPDIVHLNSSKAGVLGGIAAKLAGKKVIFTAHGMYYFTNTPPLKKWAYTWTEKFAALFWDRLIAVSKQDAGLALKHKLLQAKNISAIYNGLPPIIFLPKAQARQQLGTEQNKVIVGCIAQYYSRKGLDVLIKATTILPEEFKRKIQIVLIGQGPERTNLEKLINDLNLRETISLKSFQVQASSLLKALDIFVLPSRYEGFPYVLLEAMQAGLPIIATNVGGNAEALDDAGILVKSENPQALAEAIQSLLSDAPKKTFP